MNSLRYNAPGSLTNNASTGKVEVASVLKHKQISREDVSSAMITSLENDQTIGKVFDLVGGVSPIEEALRSLQDTYLSRK